MNGDVQTCDVCGYESDQAVVREADGVLRCLHCRERVRFGRVSTEAERDEVGWPDVPPLGLGAEGSEGLV